MKRKESTVFPISWSICFSKAQNVTPTQWRLHRPSIPSVVYSTLFTAEEKVAYFVKLSAAKKETAYDVLSDMLLDSRFDKEEIDRERGVIIEEIRMYNDDPMSKVHTDFTRHFFGDQPLGWDIAGPEENIMSVTRDDFLKFRETHYPASACVVIAAGNVTHEENLSFTQKYFRFENSGAKVAPKPFLPMDGDRSLLTERKNRAGTFCSGVSRPRGGGFCFTCAKSFIEHFGRHNVIPAFLPDT